jgi:hypothetical protein
MDVINSVSARVWVSHFHPRFLLQVRLEPTWVEPLTGLHSKCRFLVMKTILATALVIYSDKNSSKLHYRMEQQFFCIFIDYRGHHRKGVAMYNAYEVNLQQEHTFHWTKKCIFEHYSKFQARKTLIIDIILPWKKNYVDLYRAAPNMFILQRHKDVLFHWLRRKKLNSTSPKINSWDSGMENSDLFFASAFFIFLVLSNLLFYSIRSYIKVSTLQKLFSLSLTGVSK